MERSKRVVFVAHPILNQNAMPEGKERSSGVMKEIVEVISESGVGIVQIPSIEISFNGGVGFKHKTKEQMDSNKYRKLCRDEAKNVLKQIEKYIEKNYNVIGVLGVELSPTWAVHQIENGHRNVPGKGIFIEEFEDEMKKKRFQVPVVGVDLNNTYSSAQKLKIFLGG